MIDDGFVVEMRLEVSLALRIRDYITLAIPVLEDEKEKEIARQVRARFNKELTRALCYGLTPLKELKEKKEEE